METYFEDQTIDKMLRLIYKTGIGEKDFVVHWLPKFSDDQKKKFHSIIAVIQKRFSKTPGPYAKWVFQYQRNLKLLADKANTPQQMDLLENNNSITILKKRQDRLAARGITFHGLFEWDVQNGVEVCKDFYSGY